MRRITTAKIGIAGLGALLLTAGLAIPASADYQPGPNDIVGVGGDTPQFALQFFADGDANANPGYNTAGDTYKLVTFNATADGNARQAYAQGSTEAAPIPLNPTDVLRAGTVPVQRVQSSGASISALLADTTAPYKINFVFSASLPSSTQQGTANTNGWHNLDVVQIADDSVKIAADTTTNAPSTLTPADLVGIYSGQYTHWNDLPDNHSGSSDLIIPEIPPSGSSIYKTFVADLATANGNSPVTLSGVKTVEQNDPTAITAASTPADAIVPFSTGRLALWNSGYFHNPATVFPGGSTLTPGVSLLTGTGAYSSHITDYVIFRDTDETSTTPWQPGSTENWVQTLFTGTDADGDGAYITTGSGQADIAASGVTYDWANLGDVHS